MTGRRALVGAFVVFALFACKRGSKSKNDDIAACNASGGQWNESGCSDTGRCEQPRGMEPDEDVDEPESDEELGEELGDE